MDRQEILDRLKAFPYERDEYWLITGSAMVMYGIKEQAGDIDLGCSVKMADLLESDGYLYGRTKDGNRWFKVGESIEVFESWLYGSTIKMEGFRVISLNGLIEMKEKIGREKDFKDIALIKSFLKEQLRKMFGFRFAKHPAYNLPAERLKAIEKTLQNRVQAFLSI